MITLNRPEARNTFTIPFAEQLEQALRTMDDLFATLCSTEDAVEGVQAYLGKRAPKWKER